MSKEVKIKEPIRIRTKKLNNGNELILLGHLCRWKKKL